MGTALLALIMMVTLILPATQVQALERIKLVMLSDSTPLSISINEDGYPVLSWGPFYVEVSSGQYYQPTEYYVLKKSPQHSVEQYGAGTLLKLCNSVSGKKQYTYVDKDVTGGITYTYELCADIGWLRPGEVETYSYTGDPKTITVPVQEHKHNYTTKVTNPTCTERGYTTHTCRGCGDSYVDSYTNATGHTYKNTIVKPTCTAAGYTVHKCTKCGDSYTDAKTDPLGHKYVHIEIAAGIGVTGSEYDKCSNCGSVINKKTIFILAPTETKITRIKAGKKAFTVNWARRPYAGYQIRYSLKSSMAKAKTKTITSWTFYSKKITKLKAKKKYYVQVRTYKIVQGTKWYSAWSAKKTVKTK